MSNFFKRHKAGIKHVIKTYQEILVWLPPAIGLVFFTRWAFPQLDPRSGIDGLGQLNAMIVNLVGGILICFSSWMTKRTYDIVFVPDELHAIYGKIREATTTGERVTAISVRVLDIGVWILCFFFWYKVIIG